MDAIEVIIDKPRFFGLSVYSVELSHAPISKKQMMSIMP